MQLEFQKVTAFNAIYPRDPFLPHMSNEATVYESLGALSAIFKSAYGLEDAQLGHEIAQKLAKIMDNSIGMLAQPLNFEEVVDNAQKQLSIVEAESRNVLRFDAAQTAINMIRANMGCLDVIDQDKKIENKFHAKQLHDFVEQKTTMRGLVDKLKTNPAEHLQDAFTTATSPKGSFDFC